LRAAAEWPIIHPYWRFWRGFCRPAKSRSKVEKEDDIDVIA
jgi:hypothetical protein